MILETAETTKDGMLMISSVRKTISKLCLNPILFWVLLLKHLKICFKTKILINRSSKIIKLTELLLKNKLENP
jgi:hypothetical protein